MYLFSSLLIFRQIFSSLASLSNSKQLTSQITFKTQYDVIDQLPQAANKGSETPSTTQGYNNVYKRNSFNQFPVHLGASYTEHGAAQASPCQPGAGPGITKAAARTRLRKRTKSR